MIRIIVLCVLFFFVRIPSAVFWRFAALESRVATALQNALAGRGKSV